ncbi:MAG: hypothetical protein ACFCAD_14530 [Pleurocapsa sp.]
MVATVESSHHTFFSATVKALNRGMRGRATMFTVHCRCTVYPCSMIGHKERSPVIV